MPMATTFPHEGPTEQTVSENRFDLSSEGILGRRCLFELLQLEQLHERVLNEIRFKA